MGREFSKAILLSRRSRRLAAASFAVSGALGLSAAPTHAQECVDTDGDGWGWDGNATCDPDSETSFAPPVASRTNDPSSSDTVQTKVDDQLDEIGSSGADDHSAERKQLDVAAAVPGSMCSDSDGDSWGWDGTASCRIGKTAPGLAYCDDSDGDGWGWDGNETCSAAPLTARASFDATDQAVVQSAGNQKQTKEGDTEPEDLVEIVLAELDDSESEDLVEIVLAQLDENESEATEANVDNVERVGNLGGVGSRGIESGNNESTEAISQRLQDRYDEGFALIEQADDFAKQERFDEARDLLDQAADLRMPIESDEHAALDRHFTTELYGTLTEVDQAERVAEAPIVFGTADQRLAVADSKLDEVEQLFADGEFEKADEALIQAFAVLGQIPDAAARSDVGQRAIDLNYELSRVGLGAAATQPITPSKSAQEVFDEALGELEVAEGSFEMGDLDDAMFFMEEAVDAMSGVLDPVDAHLQKAFRDRVFALGAQINAARFGPNGSSSISPTETLTVANLAIDKLAEESDFAGSIIFRSATGQDIEVHIFEGQITRATLAKLPLSDEEMLALQLALELKKGPVPVASLSGSISNGDTAKQAAATYSGYDLRGEFFGTPTSLPGTDSSGAPPPALTTPSDRTSSFDEAKKASSPSPTNSSSDSNSTDTASDTAQQAADTYSNGSLDGEFGGL